MDRRFIEVKGKKYPVEDDMDYAYTLKFRDMQEQFERGKLSDYDIEHSVIGLLTEAICPMLKINMKDMSVEGKKLKLSEVRKLIIDLRTAFQVTVTQQLAPMVESKGQTAIMAGDEIKNSEGATGA